MISTDLQRLVSDSRAKLHLAYPWWLRPFMLRGVIGITLGRRIYVAREYLERPTADVERLIRHELVHVRQVNRLGLLRFLWRYAKEYVAHRRAGLTSAEAYRRISFEVEAYAAEEAV